jgi:ribA/ribD-fused uncharacterized protein
VIIVPELPTGPNIVSRFEGEYEFLSNFYPVALVIRGIAYPSVEHAYQASKFHTDEVRLLVRSQRTAAMAKHKAREHKHLIRDDWEKVKTQVMHALGWLKYNTHSVLGERLDATGNMLLIEGNDHGDRFWGVSNGLGLNNLGLDLMGIRLLKRFNTWCVVTGRHAASGMGYNPWLGRYTQTDVQRDWTAFASGFAHGHPTDYKEYQK